MSVLWSKVPFCWLLYCLPDPDVITAIALCVLCFDKNAIYYLLLFKCKQVSM